VLKCQNNFTPLLKSDGLLHKLCDRCRSADKKYRDKHKEQRKEYRESNEEHTKEYGIYYRELHLLIKMYLKKKQKNIVKQIRIKQTLKIVKESHVNVVLLQEKIRFRNIKNHHVTKNL
jgi:hypothetical protein